MTYKWNFMVYMAGDNGKVFSDGEQLMYDLQAYGSRNIAEMAEIGSTEDVAIVVQYDTLAEHQYTPRFFVEGSSKTGRLVEKIPSVNTGDPRNLTDFIVWASSHYPAENLALILWNHGAGWKEDDIYQRYRHIEEISHRDQVRAVHSRQRFLRQSLFLSTAAEVMGIEDDETRAICYDDSSMDFLDNQELVKALTAAENVTGQRLAIIGMDACLMSMIEVAYELQGCADYLVGSQEVERAEGWPYSGILAGLTRNPKMSSGELSQLIVEEFRKSCERMDRSGGAENTQSAINLKALSVTINKLTNLNEVIAKNYDIDPYVERAISRIRHQTQRFRDQDYLDLRHFLQLFQEQYSGNLELTKLAGDLVDQLSLRTPESLVAVNFHGLGCPNANGLSIYFPTVGCSLYYDKLAFAASKWNEVIRLANQIKM